MQELISRKFADYNWLVHVNAPDGFYINTEHPILTLSIVVSGSNTISAHEGTSRSFDLPSFELIYLPSGIHPIKFEIGRNECFQIELSRSFLEDMGDDHPVISGLISTLDSQSKLMVGAGRIPLNYISKTVISNMRRCSEKGATL